MNGKKKTSRQKAQQAAAIVLLLTLEMLAASAAGTLTYLILAPVAYRIRGYTALGAEFFVAYAVTIIAYLLIHRAIFKVRRRQV